MTDNVKKIGVNELRAIVKEAISDLKKKKAKPVTESSTIKITMGQLRTMIREAVGKKLQEEMEMPSAAAGSPTPKAGDKVQLASGKTATVADVDLGRQMVFITRDGIKMIGVPMDYVSVVDSDPEELADFSPSAPAPEEGKEERIAHLEKLLSRGLLTAPTRKKLEAELDRLRGDSVV